MVLLKKLIRIIIDYKFSLLPIVLFELIYLTKGYKGNKFIFSPSKFMHDNIPCPYYFLSKIKKVLKNNGFNKLIDLGSGSGRSIYFFNQKFKNKNYVGIEFFSEQYQYCKKLFSENKNIEIINDDFTKNNFFQYNADCYFFNLPFRDDIECFKFLDKTINSLISKRNILFIFVNCNNKIIDQLKNIQCIDKYYISNIKGYSIYRLNR